MFAGSLVEKGSESVANVSKVKRSKSVIENGLLGTLRFHKQGCKSPIQMVMDRHRRSGFYETKFGYLAVNVGDDTFVFFRFDAARTVN